MLFKVCKTSEVQEGTPKVVDVDTKQILLCSVDGKLYATDNTCPHAGGPLNEGQIENNIVVCPLHGWSFDLKTGDCTLVPGMNIQTYPVKIEGDDVLVEIEK